MQTNSSAELYLPAAGGTEELLAAEISRITGHTTEHARGGVWVRGDARTAMLLNLHSRLAQRVLWPVIDGPYRDEHDRSAAARAGQRDPAGARVVDHVAANPRRRAAGARVPEGDAPGE